MIDSFAVYWVHRLMHVAPLLWRAHRVHHTDSLVDVSTSLRNHPLELIVVLPASAAVILVVGAPPSVVIVAQTISMAATIWQHADIAVPASLDRMLSLIIVTPRLHRLHHSPDRRLHDRNYGELITLWDRIFGTFSQHGGRLRVGLDGQAVPADGLLAQLWSPRFAA
jgi:sterol desaturase/sphingolipid hydroxylase (fatty acid hydroxylase superfamily)